MGNGWAASLTDRRCRPKVTSRDFWGRQERMSGLIATAKPRRIKAAHRRRWKCASGRFVQRYYDPAIGRFLSVDPVTANANTGAGFNRYSYAVNNPYRFTDPDGRCEAPLGTRIKPAGCERGRSIDYGTPKQASSTGSRSDRAAPSNRPSNGSQPSSSRSAAGSAKSGATGFYGKVMEPSTEVEAAAAYGAGGRYKRDVATGKDSAGIVLIGVGAHGKAAGAVTLAPSVDVLKGGYAWGAVDAPVDIEVNGKLFGLGLNINFDPGSKLEGSLNFAPLSAGAYTGVSVMFDDTLVGD